MYSRNPWKKRKFARSDHGCISGAAEGLRVRLTSNEELLIRYDEHTRAAQAARGKYTDVAREHAATYRMKNTRAPSIAGKRWSFKPNSAIVCNAEV